MTALKGVVQVTAVVADEEMIEVVEGVTKEVAAVATEVTVGGGAEVAVEEVTLLSLMTNSPMRREHLRNKDRQKIIHIALTKVTI